MVITKFLLKLGQQQSNSPAEMNDCRGAVQYEICAMVLICLFVIVLAVLDSSFQNCGSQKPEKPGGLGPEDWRVPLAPVAAPGKETPGHT